MADAPSRTIAWSTGDRVRAAALQRTGGQRDTEPEVRRRKSLRDFVAGAVIHEDRDLIVINKPAGVAVHGGSG